jgi:2-polyprenyl-6-methoxyphenol hydroxylase-like FAD-dependent oxidoreductase
MEIAIVGGGITGLALALNLHKRGIACRVFESAPEIKELGVGITLLPHAIRELTELGLHDELAAFAIENRESLFFNRFGQLIYKEARGKYAGYNYPEYGTHRGKLHTLMYRHAVSRLGPERIIINRTFAGLEQNPTGVTLRFRDTSQKTPPESVHADIAIGCDGINSAVRKQFYPHEKVAFTGINTWRGVTRRDPILGGRSYMRIGSIRTGKLVIYPIIDNVDGNGKQLINWTAEIERPGAEINDWNKPGSHEDFISIYQGWKFDWLDVPEMIRGAELILEYPMVDKNPIDRWTFGRVTFAGDAAHPMYPRGSNGAAQGLIDARVLAEILHQVKGPKALKIFEEQRLPATTKLVLTNRSHPPDYINIKVEELTGDRPFENLDRFISQDELRRISDDYKKVAGFAQADLPIKPR